MSDTKLNPGSESGLSVSMIVRDEATRLPGCIAALKPIASEVCIVDTGSIDDTVAVAQGLGCRVSTVAWSDDFAAARNAALVPCQYPWILSIDADEIIAEEDHEGIRALTHGAPDRAYRFTTRNYTDVLTTSGFEPVPPGAPHSAGFSGWFPSTKVRLFPNREDIRFEGVVHELPNKALFRAGIPIVDTPISIHHHPFLNARAGAREAKQRLYLELGKKKVAEYPDDPRLHSELGDQYIDMGDIGAAVAAYRTAVALAPSEGRWLKNLGAALYLLNHYPQAQQALRLAVTLDPEMEEGWRNLGVVLIQMGAWSDACDALTRALALGERHPDTYRYLAIALSRNGERARAIDVMERMLARFPGHAEGEALYGTLAAGDPPSDA